MDFFFFNEEFQIGYLGSWTFLPSYRGAGCGRMIPAGVPTWCQQEWQDRWFLHLFMVWKMRRMKWGTAPASWLTPKRKCVLIPWGSPAELLWALAALTSCPQRRQEAALGCQPSLARGGPAEILPVQTPQDTLNYCPLLLLACSDSKGYWELDAALLEVTSDCCFPQPQNKAFAFHCLHPEVSKKWSGGISTLNTQVTQTFVKYWQGLAGDLEQSQDLVILSWVNNLLSE